MGGPESFAVLAIAVPVIAVVWIARSMHRIQKAQEDMKHQLDIIERSLPRERPR